MPVEVSLQDLHRLQLVDEDEMLGSIKKLAKKLTKAGIISQFRQGTGLFTLTQKNEKGDCIFLNSQRKCEVYVRQDKHI